MHLVHSPARDQDAYPRQPRSKTRQHVLCRHHVGGQSANLAKIVACARENILGPDAPEPWIKRDLLRRQIEPVDRFQEFQALCRSGDKSLKRADSAMSSEHAPPRQKPSVD